MENIKSGDPNDLVDVFEKVLTKATFKAFGKAKVGGEPKVSKHLRKLEERKQTLLNTYAVGDKLIEEIDEEIRRSLINQQTQSFERELSDLKSLQQSRGKAAAVFNIRKRAAGEKFREEAVASRR